MIKRIIFDIDNTLFNTEKDCLDTYQEFFTKKELTDYSRYLYDLLEKYDKDGTYIPEELVEFVKNNAPFAFSKQDFDDIRLIYHNHATLLEKDLPSTLEKLSQKYELVILTSWYYDDQVARLKKAGILKYFKKVYALENAGLKPHKEAYEVASEGLNMEDCLMVGDSIRKDVEMPIKLGMKAIMYNPNNVSTEYQSIKKISDLLKEEF